MARHRAAPEHGDPAAGPGGAAHLPDVDADLDPGLDPADLVPADLVPADLGPADLDPVDLVDPLRTPRDSGGLSPWLVGLLAFAVVVFVVGVAWAVTSPSRTGSTPPVGAASADVAIQGGADGGTGTPVPTPAGSSNHPGTSPSTVPSGGPVPSGSSAAPAPSASQATAAPAQAGPVLTAQASIENHWGPNNIQVSVELTAHASGVTGWRIQLTCTGTSGFTLSVFNVWSATLAASSATGVTFTNATWNGALAPATPTYFGFQATWGPTDQPQAVPACSVSVTTT